MKTPILIVLTMLVLIVGGALVIATELFGKFLNQPLDRGASFIDGRPILGGSKTYAVSYFHLWRQRPLRRYSGPSGYSVSS
jgi:hypothetical protein